MLKSLTPDQLRSLDLIAVTTGMLGVTVLVFSIAWHPLVYVTVILLLACAVLSGIVRWSVIAPQRLACDCAANRAPCGRAASDNEQ